MGVIPVDAIECRNEGILSGIRERRHARIYSHAHGGQNWRCEPEVPVVHSSLIHETVDHISDALQQDSCGLFRSGTSLVFVNEEHARIHSLDAAGLGLLIQRRFPVVGPAKNGEMVPKNLSPQVLKALSSESAALPIPRLTSVVRGPYALSDGSIIDTPEYESSMLRRISTPDCTRLKNGSRLMENSLR